MNLKLLKTDIKTNMIPKFLIFVGEEQALCRQYIKSISDTLSKGSRYYSSADEVLVETANNIKEDFVYVILNDDKICKNPNYIKALIDTGRNIILYYTNEVPTQFCKENSDYVVEFAKLDKYTILAYLMKKLDTAKISVDQNSVELLVDRCNCDLGICENELDKIITLAQTNSNRLMTYMESNGFSDYRKTDMFNFVQKLLNRDTTAFDLAQRLDESLISMLTVLYNQARSRLVTTSNSYYVKVMRIVNFLDSGIKDGTISDEYALDYLLLKLLKR